MKRQQQPSYFTYRPLSNLCTPPPSSKASSTSTSVSPAGAHDGDALDPKYRGPAIHLVNLVPCAASLATASVPLVQAIIARANLPIETIALAVCVLDSLDTKFSRTWRLSCPLPGLLSGDGTLPSASSKRHTLPASSTLAYRQAHIDSVSPEIIILAALVIAAKFTEDAEAPTQYYCRAWGADAWSHHQLNATERCIMASLDYRIMPLCAEDCLADAMVDMQLAAQQWDDDQRQVCPLTPPDSGASSEDDFVPSHTRSKTVAMPVSGFRLD
ncbi:hypothetical protein NLU13_0716 [Sarocladium strictum]|uniref:Cyclin N-terminal domain-containing protein n=1 Tax=Sarocladium strictum TaxID=5046 RepID=A0AA39GPK4_SARSR|nr:hypothetical protein NLU13_0716 [Sarocladium strictum]